MAKRDRTSRFTSGRVTVEPPSNSDTVTWSERFARELAWQAERPLRSPTAWDEMRRNFGVHDDHEVATDAVRSVVIEADEWRATWVLARRDGAFVVRALHLEPIDALTPASGITSNLLRELSPAAAIATAAKVEPEDDGWAGSLMLFAEQFRAEHGPTEKATPRRRGRPKVDDGELLWISAMYLDELDRGPGVIRRVAERLGRDSSESTVRDRIRMARERGFLTSTKQGRRGGEVGPAMYAALGLPAPAEGEPGPGLAAALASSNLANEVRARLQRWSDQHDEEGDQS